MTFNVIHGNPTKVKFRLKLGIRVCKLHKGNFAVNLGLQTHQRSPYFRNHGREIKGDQLTLCMFDGTKFYC